jgi:hypothetical protein
MTVRRGVGATELRLGDMGGSAVAVLATGAGAVSAAGHPTTGVVGAMDRVCNCRGTWSGPGRLGSHWAAVTAYVPDVCCVVSGHSTVAGPAGAWQWSWSGLYDGSSELVLGGPSTPVIAAYAPIGDDWKLFAAAKDVCSLDC